jgi:hypothetical protein
MTSLYITAGICLASVSLNIYLLYKEFKRKPESKKQQDMRLIQDLMTNGRSLIEIKRIAPSDYFIRSPRDIR